MLGKWCRNRECTHSQIEFISDKCKEVTKCLGIGSLSHQAGPFIVSGAGDVLRDMEVWKNGDVIVETGLE